jgi:glycosyltransferase involved in cell wall biosynthesis
MSFLRQQIQFDKLVRAVGTEKSQKGVSDSLKGSKIAVLIPAYNEAENLKILLPRVPPEVGGRKVTVLVVDDGSEDGTFETCREMGVLAIRNPIQRGGGAALRLGYDVLRMANVEICITMDADGQHNPEEIGELVSPILKNRGDIVIGSRILGSREKDSPIRLFGVYFFGFIINRLLGTKITDPSSGFRAFKMNVLKSIYLYEDQYHTSELIIIAAKEGKNICEVPITIYRRKFGESKKGKNWQYGFHFAKTVIRSWWR